MHRPLAAAVASVATTLAFYPLDVTRTARQAGAASAVLRRPYAGAALDACSTFASAGVYFSAYEAVLASAMPLASVVAPSAAIAASTVVAAPASAVVKRRQMRGNRLASALPPLRLSTVRDLYLIAVARNLPKTVVKYAVYEALLRTLLPLPMGLRGGVSAALASLLTAVLFAPVDYVKTQMALSGRGCRAVLAATRPWRRLFLGARMGATHSVLSNACAHSLLETLAPRQL